MIEFKSKGDFSKVSGWLVKVKQPIKRNVLDKYGRRGVEALSEATPKETGLTAASWSYSIEITAGRASIFFFNSNINNGVQIAVILQYGHGTGTGGWVEGRDYINPALVPVFEDLANEAWKEVTDA